MATAGFKTESPFVKRDERTHDASDLKYQKFLDTVSGAVSNKKTVVMALFGVGRAGKYFNLFFLDPVCRKCRLDFVVPTN